MTDLVMPSAGNLIRSRVKSGAIRPTQSNSQALLVPVRGLKIRASLMRVRPYGAGCSFEAGGVSRTSPLPPSTILLQDNPNDC